MLNRSTATSVGAALLCALPFAAQAQDPPRTYHVHYDDLNLKTDAGTQALYRRIDVAAQFVCQDFEGREIKHQMQHAHCQANAISDAVARIGHPHLTAYYSAINGGKSPMIISQATRRIPVNR